MTLTPIPRCHGLVMEPILTSADYYCVICGTRVREVNGSFLPAEVDAVTFDLIGPKRSHFLNPLVQLDAQIQAEEHQP